MDPELEAMQRALAAIENLDPAGRMRVAEWLAGKVGVPVKSPVVDKSLEPAQDSFADFADFFHATDPQSNAERALVGAYWLTTQSAEPFGSQALNSLLKDLGFQVSNITGALTQNMAEKPALVVQTKKGGSTRQARKLYKITDAGNRRVRTMLERATNNGDANG